MFHAFTHKNLSRQGCIHFVSLYRSCADIRLDQFASSSYEGIFGMQGCLFKANGLSGADFAC